MIDDECIYLCAVHGCRDLHPIDGAVVFRTEHSAVVVCNDTQHTWYVTCGRDGHWVGDVINCSRPTSGIRRHTTRLTNLAMYHKLTELRLIDP